MKIAGVSIWIFVFGFAVMAVAGMTAMKSAQLVSGQRTLEHFSKKMPKDETKTRTEQAARKYFASILKVHSAIKSDLGKTEMPPGLLLGDRLEMEALINTRKAKMEEIHDERKAAEAELEAAEKISSNGHLKALRNCWEETIRRDVCEPGQKAMEMMSFEEAVELGRSVSKTQ